MIGHLRKVGGWIFVICIMAGGSAIGWKNLGDYPVALKIFSKPHVIIPITVILIAFIVIFSLKKSSKDSEKSKGKR